jgi:hypothetical protein
MKRNCGGGGTKFCLDIGSCASSQAEIQRAKRAEETLLGSQAGHEGSQHTSEAWRCFARM